MQYQFLSLRSAEYWADLGNMRPQASEFLFKVQPNFSSAAVGQNRKAEHRSCRRTQNAQGRITLFGAKGARRPIPGIEQLAYSLGLATWGVTHARPDAALDLASSRHDFPTGN
jgi:hypothetical protein